MAGNKRKALLALKKKKYQEVLLEKTETQLINLEELVKITDLCVFDMNVLEYSIILFARLLIRHKL